jgi:hypothetical protein
MQPQMLMRWIAVSACLTAAMSLATPAFADGPRRHREPRYHPHWGPPRHYYAPPVYYYPPPPPYHYAPPPVYYPPPAYIAPGFTFGFTVPLR